MEGMIKDIFVTDLVKMKIFATSSNKASQNPQQAGWTRFTRLCW
jgi:hypothetical protein